MPVSFTTYVWPPPVNECTENLCNFYYDMFQLRKNLGSVWQVKINISSSTHTHRERNAEVNKHLRLWLGLERSLTSLSFLALEHLDCFITNPRVVSIIICTALLEDSLIIKMLTYKVKVSIQSYTYLKHEVMKTWSIPE